MPPKVKAPAGPDKAGPLSLQQAVALVEQRLGRKLTPTETVDVQAVLAGGATAEDLATLELNASDSTAPLFPTFVVSGEIGAVAAQAKKQVQATSAPAAPAGAWDPNSAGVSTGSTPNLGYDPFALGPIGGSNFLLGQTSTNQGRSRAQVVASPGFQKWLQGLSETGPARGALIEAEIERRMGLGGRSIQQDIEANVSTFVSEVFKWDEARQANLQQSLVAAGFLSAGSFRPGFIDDSTLNALKTAITAAQRREVSLPDLLAQAARGEQERLAGSGSGGGAGGAGGSVSIHEASKNAYKSQLASIYMNNWGEPPPPGYIEKIAASGMNTMEFNSHERAKPAFRNSPRYQMERISLEAEMANTFGALG